VTEQNETNQKREIEIMTKNHSSQRDRQSKGDKGIGKSRPRRLESRKKCPTRKIMAKLTANRERMMNKMDSQLEETKACKKKTRRPGIWRQIQKNKIRVGESGSP
jgi:hypothetical protein